MTVLFRENRGFPFEEAVRKDSAVHVSLSSDSPVKQPGNPEVSISPVPQEGTQGADEAKAAETYRWPVPLVNEELQRRAVTPVRVDRRANDGGYMAHDDPVSTPKTSKIFRTANPRVSSV